jgi:hypothetical protein
MSQSARRPARRAPSSHGAGATSSGGAGAETTKHPHGRDRGGLRLCGVRGATRNIGARLWSSSADLCAPPAPPSSGGWGAGRELWSLARVDTSDAPTT